MMNVCQLNFNIREQCENLDCPGIYCVVPENEGVLGYSQDGTCGDQKSCDRSGFGNCCSSAGKCGFTSQECGSGCQKAFGYCSVSSSGPSSPSTKAGGEKTSPDGNCCSKYGFCGRDAGHCDLTGGCQKKFGTCSSPKPGSAPISTDGRCGGTNKISCLGSTLGDCCSSDGWCGSSELHCEEGCKSQFGICKPPKNPRVSKNGTCGTRGGKICGDPKFGPCCSKEGYCGKDQAYCGQGWLVVLSIVTRGVLKHFFQSGELFVSWFLHERESPNPRWSVRYKQWRPHVYRRIWNLLLFCGILRLEK
jgi:hypothetical protein